MEKVSTMLNNTVEIYHFSIIWKSSPRDSHQVGPVKNRSAYPGINSTPPRARESSIAWVPAKLGLARRTFSRDYPGKQY